VKKFCSVVKTIYICRKFINYEKISKVYKVKVGSVIVEDYPNLRVTSIAYYQNDELTYKVIQTEKNPTKRNIFGNY